MIKTEEVAIIGSGFGGIITALQLKKNGINSFSIFERSHEIGGTWRDNIYPGCACDVPSILYSISDEPNPKWNNFFSSQAEILQYLKTIIKKNDLEKHIKYNHDILGITFDNNDAIWKINAQNGNQYSARMVILANGPLNRAFIPKIKGLETFSGNYFHTSAWNKFDDLSNKNVAIIGTGASAAQVIPSIADKVKNLYVVQRTPAWVAPRHDIKISTFTQNLFKHLPFTQKIGRQFMFWLLEYMGTGFFKENSIYRLNRKIALNHLKKQVKDENIRQQLLPKYRMGCKRILRSDDYFLAFNKKNVHLIAEGLDKIENKTLFTKNHSIENIDTIIFATGFEVAEANFYTEINGLNNISLSKLWNENNVEAYKGTLVHNFPNLAIILGPNTGLGHNSVVYMMEAQMPYILEYLKTLKQLKKNEFLNIKYDVQKAYNVKIQKMFKNTAWASGCKSWYMNKNGINTTLFPDLSYKYAKMMKLFDKTEFEFE
jgi:cation diffusion facilitator CzcD-associated flavoprotein CzcO